ncbi:hypothetical protein M5D96_006382 [Drosophila gunungcola]|uniref:Uncharacterized protein n=1 Tax=Drosophila gunungcola TaxID=103775 RepID=A0A9P9YPX4_9MUSC|nr:hypothetical protein M5D96_006382 [Drosophila gunungcola]
MVLGSKPKFPGIRLITPSFKCADLFFINLPFHNVYQFWFLFAALAKSYTIIAVVVIISHIFIPCTQLIGKIKNSKSETDL